jgi:hypothetical protein
MAAVRGSKVSIVVVRHLIPGRASHLRRFEDAASLALRDPARELGGGSLGGRAHDQLGVERRHSSALDGNAVRGRDSRFGSRRMRRSCSCESNAFVAIRRSEAPAVSGAPIASRCACSASCSRSVVVVTVSSAGVVFIAGSHFLGSSACVPCWASRSIWAARRARSWRGKAAQRTPHFLQCTSSTGSPSITLATQSTSVSPLTVSV